LEESLTLAFNAINYNRHSRFRIRPYEKSLGKGRNSDAIGGKNHGALPIAKANLFSDRVQTSNELR